MTLPRLLVIMGSGETAPTMRGPHRRVVERVGAALDGPLDAVMLDTPFGFQENAPILASTAAKYFRDAVGIDVHVAGLPRLDVADAVAVESGIAAVRTADWVFAGPGSPTFALAQWRGTAVPGALADKLRTGGAVVFSSAAALTLGCVTVPVYEIYKVGMDPRWEDGLDLMGVLGVNAAVIPHFDNAEGGNHDTRFCYLGERRLALLEPELPDGAYVLGIDEHTGVIIDVDAETAEVVGKGGVTMRRAGVAERVESGETIPLDVLRRGRRDDITAAAPAAVTVEAPTTGAPPGEPATESLDAEIDRCVAGFDGALQRRDADAAVAAMLALDTAITDWSADTLQSDQVDRAPRRAALDDRPPRRGRGGWLRDPRDVVAPVVEAALMARAVARAEKAYAVSDALRDGLDAAGIEVRDTPDGAEWHLR